MAEKLTQEQVEERVASNYDGSYRLTSEYISMKNEVILLHLGCNKTYKLTRLKTFFENGGKCPHCKEIKSNSTKKVTEEEFIKRIKEQTGDEYSYISGFTKMNEKVIMRHNICEHEWEIEPKMFTGVKQRRCPKCANKNRGKYALKENYLESILKDSYDGNEYKWLSEYSGNNKHYHKILHIECDREYEVRPNDFQQGYRCPYCSQELKESRNLGYIKDYLIKNKVEFEIEKKFEECKNKSYLPFDIYIPSKNLLIEYDGEQHFKPTFGCDKENRIELLKNTHKRDLIKNEYAIYQKISLLRIPYGLKKKDYIDIIESILSNEENMIKIIKKYKLLYVPVSGIVILNEDEYYNKYCCH